MSEIKKNKGGAHLIKKEKTPMTKKQKIRLGIILALVIILAILVVGFAIYRSWAKAPEIPVTPKPIPSLSLDDNEDEPNVTGGEEEPVADIGEDPLVEGGDRKKDFYTFLVVGRDTGGGGNTDTILLGAYDIANQKLNVMSIPRDTMVNVPWDIKRINSVYNMYGGNEKGIQALYKEVSQLVGFVPDFEVVVEWDAVGELVDAIDGVYFDVPFRMYYNDLSQDFIIDLQKGYQLLDGSDAMELLRYRQQSDDNGNVVSGGYPNGDIGRIQTQQAFLKAVVAQCLKIENVTRIQELAKVFTDNVQTDLTIGNLVWFAEQAVFGGLSMENVNFITLPGNHNGFAWCRTYENNQSYVLPDADELIKLVNESFNPYLEDRKISQLDIMYKNSDGSLSSTSGTVEDKPAALAPVKPTPKPEPSEDPEAEPSPSDSSEMPEWLGGGGSTPAPEPEPEPTSDVTEEPIVSIGPVIPPTPTPTPTPEVEEDRSDDSEMPDWLRPVGQ